MGAGNRSIPNLAFVDKPPPFFRAREKMLQVLAIDRAIMIYLHPFQGAHCSRRSVPGATLPLALGWFTNAPSGRIAHPTKLAIPHPSIRRLVLPTPLCRLALGWFANGPLPRPLLIAVMTPSRAASAQI